MITQLPEDFRGMWNLREDLVRVRITTSTWKDILLSELDRPIIRGEVRQLRGKRIGPGVYEITLEPLKETSK